MLCRVLEQVEEVLLSQEMLLDQQCRDLILCDVLLDIKANAVFCHLASRRKQCTPMQFRNSKDNEIIMCTQGAIKQSP